MIRACIFDMDGTVADTLATIAYFANSALQRFGLPIIETGKNSGIYTIGVTWGFRGEKELRETGADVIVSSPAEILAIALGGEKRT